MIDRANIALRNFFILSLRSVKNIVQLKRTTHIRILWASQITSNWANFLQSFRTTDWMAGSSVDDGFDDDKTFSRRWTRITRSVSQLNIFFVNKTSRRERHFFAKLPLQRREELLRTSSSTSEDTYVAAAAAATTTSVVKRAVFIYIRQSGSTSLTGWLTTTTLNRARYTISWRAMVQIHRSFLDPSPSVGGGGCGPAGGNG